jgi:hypothetical protein
MKKLKFNSIFSNIQIKPIVSEEKDKYLSVASLNELKKFIPEIDITTNIDLLAIAFDACVVNRVNKNGDVIDTPTALSIAKNFINKPINIEHNRNIIVGTILSSSFSKFGSSEELKEEEIKDTKTPFNITLGGIIWKIVDHDLAEKLEDSNDPTSDNYMKISASWELGFDKYNIIVLEENEKNIENGKYITDANEVAKLENNLRGFGGSGKISDNQYIYRQVIGKVLPLGVGLTLNPAADVKGVAVKQEKTDSLAAEANENNISQKDVLDVKKERINMKITKIEEITDALLKEVTASSITDFISEELKKVNDQFLAEKTSKENDLKSANEKLSAISADNETVKKEVEDLKQKLSMLEAEKAAKAQEEAFNMRMASLDEEYDLSDEDRQVITKQIKNLDEKTFEEYKDSLAVLMKEKSKAFKKALSEKTQKETTQAEVKTEAVVAETKASEVVEKSNEEVVNQAVDNGTKASNQIPNSSSAQTPSVKEKYAKAFELEGFEVFTK